MEAMLSINIFVRLSKKEIIQLHKLKNLNIFDWIFKKITNFYFYVMKDWESLVQALHYCAELQKLYDSKATFVQQSLIEILEYL